VCYDKASFSEGEAKGNVHAKEGKIKLKLVGNADIMPLLKRSLVPFYD
jgi:hypothetical protein